MTKDLRIVAVSLEFNFAILVLQTFPPGISSAAIYVQALIAPSSAAHVDYKRRLENMTIGLAVTLQG